MSKPMICDFMTAFHQYKKEANIPADFASLDDDTMYDILDCVREDFVDVYSKNNLDTKEKINQIIEEYGWQKMITNRFDDVLEIGSEMEQLSLFLQDPVKNNFILNCMLFDMCQDDIY
jgi:hypothetical protein